MLVGPPALHTSTDRAHRTPAFTPESRRERLAREDEQDDIDKEEENRNTEFEEKIRMALRQACLWREEAGDSRGTQRQCIFRKSESKDKAQEDGV